MQPRLYIHATSPAYFRGNICRWPCDDEVSRPWTTHWALHEGKKLRSTQFPCVTQQLFETICRNTCELMTFVVANSFANWRRFCLCGPTRHWRLWERSF